MDFTEQLNNYINKIKCSSKELSNASGLSPTVISRYRNGDRTPSIRSKQLNSLVEGLQKLSLEKNISISKEEIYQTLSKSLNDVHIDLEQLIRNFNELVSILNISIAELSRKTGYDSSFLSKIRTGNTLPPKPQLLINDVCNFIVHKYTKENDLIAISQLINCSIEDLKN